MEKSIETIWKSGFIGQEDLVVPRLNNLYNQKSIHIIDKFKRMFKYNHFYIYGLALAHLMIGVSMGAYFAGTGMCILLGTLTIISRKNMKLIDKIDWSASSYAYLKSFDNYLKGFITKLGQFYQVFYPLYFSFMVIGFLETEDGQQALHKIMNNPDTLLFHGLPIVWLSSVIVLLIIVTIFSKPLYRLDLKAVYGGIMKKLDELLKDMEELRQ